MRQRAKSYLLKLTNIHGLSTHRAEHLHAAEDLFPGTILLATGGIALSTFEVAMATDNHTPTYLNHSHGHSQMHSHTPAQIHLLSPRQRYRLWTCQLDDLSKVIRVLSRVMRIAFVRPRKRSRIRNPCQVKRHSYKVCEKSNETGNNASDLVRLCCSTSLERCVYPFQTLSPSFNSVQPARDFWERHQLRCVTENGTAEVRALLCHQVFC